jgi:hypothetical protein
MQHYLKPCDAVLSSSKRVESTLCSLSTSDRLGAFHVADCPSKAARIPAESVAAHGTPRVAMPRDVYTPISPDIIRNSAHATIREQEFCTQLTHARGGSSHQLFPLSRSHSLGTRKIKTLQITACNSLFSFFQSSSHIYVAY